MTVLSRVSSRGVKVTTVVFRSKAEQKEPMVRGGIGGAGAGSRRKRRTLKRILFDLLDKHFSSAIKHYDNLTLAHARLPLSVKCKRETSCG